MPHWILADAPTKSVQGVFVASIIVIIVALAAFAGYSYLRKWMRSSDEPSGGRGFTLADLRDLHRQGKISDVEYEATKAQLVGAAKKMVDQLPPCAAEATHPTPAACRWEPLAAVGGVIYVSDGGQCSNRLRLPEPHVAGRQGASGCQPVRADEIGLPLGRCKSSIIPGTSRRRS